MAENYSEKMMREARQGKSPAPPEPHIVTIKQPPQAKWAVNKFRKVSKAVRFINLIIIVGAFGYVAARYMNRHTTYRQPVVTPQSTQCAAPNDKPVLSVPANQSETIQYYDNTYTVAVEKVIYNVPSNTQHGCDVKGVVAVLKITGNSQKPDTVGKYNTLNIALEDSAGNTYVHSIARPFVQYISQQGNISIAYKTVDASLQLNGAVAWELEKDANNAGLKLGLKGYDNNGASIKKYITLPDEPAQKSPGI